MNHKLEYQALTDAGRGKNIFYFKNFSIDQTDATWPVGTDSILLGASVDLDGVHDVLDACAGTGVLSLMTLSRCPDLRVFAVEIDAHTAGLCRQNIGSSPWHARASVLCADLDNWCRTTEQKFDLVVSNPPYFKNAPGAGMSPRNLARHGFSFSFEMLATCCRKVLRSDGKVCLVVPHAAAHHVIRDFNETGFFVERRMDICHATGTAYSLTVLSFSNVLVKPRYQTLQLKGRNGEMSDTFAELVSGLLGVDHS